MHNISLGIPPWCILGLVPLGGSVQFRYLHTKNTHISSKELSGSRSIFTFYEVVESFRLKGLSSFSNIDEYNFDSWLADNHTSIIALNHLILHSLD